MDLREGVIGAGGSGLVAITALLLNYRGFSSLDSRFSSLDSRFSSLDSRFSSLENRFSSLEDSVNGRFQSIERRLDPMKADIKDLNRTMTALEVDVALVKDKVGL